MHIAFNNHFFGGTKAKNFGVAYIIREKVKSFNELIAIRVSVRKEKLNSIEYLKHGSKGTLHWSIHR